MGLPGLPVEVEQLVVTDVLFLEPMVRLDVGRGAALLVPLWPVVAVGIGLGPVVAE